jgi:hypothetical protein
MHKYHLQQITMAAPPSPSDINQSTFLGGCDKPTVSFPSNDPSNLNPVLFIIRSSEVVEILRIRF